MAILPDPIRGRPIGETLAELLRKAILSGELKAGAEIRQEQLAQQYGVSRLPVREALQSLERDGLVIIQSNRRVVVVEVTDADLKDHYEVRALIEGELAGRAAGNIDEIGELREAFLAGKKFVDSGDASSLVRANETFHRAVWDASRSSRLYTLASQLWTGIPPYRPVLFPRQMHSSVDEHQQIVEAIAEGNAELAKALMTHHILRARDDLLSVTRSVNPANNDGQIYGRLPNE